jgi:hypothetical protein
MRGPLPSGSMIALASFQCSSGIPRSRSHAFQAAVGSGGPCNWQPSASVENRATTGGALTWCG